MTKATVVTPPRIKINKKNKERANNALGFKLESGAVLALLVLARGLVVAAEHEDLVGVADREREDVHKDLGREVAAVGVVAQEQVALLRARVSAGTKDLSEVGRRAENRGRGGGGGGGLCGSSISGIGGETP